MSEASFYMLCEELRPYLTKQTTKLRKPVSVETQVAATLYYLADEGRMRKVSNSLGLGKATVHSPCYLCDFRKTWGKVHSTS